VTAAWERGQIVAYAATAPGWLEHLYVLPQWHGQGIGTQLVDHARAAQDELRLWVFQKNAKARAFYERHGFTLESLHDGSGNFEREPDALYCWRRNCAVDSW
jgi:GNAT superfamily N-acetyltransferase